MSFFNASTSLFYSYLKLLTIFLMEVKRLSNISVTTYFVLSIVSAGSLKFRSLNMLSINLVFSDIISAITSFISLMSFILVTKLVWIEPRMSDIGFSNSIS